MRALVTGEDGTERLIQDSRLAALLPPRYWLDGSPDLLTPGTVLLSGTVAMLPAWTSSRGTGAPSCPTR